MPDLAGAGRGGARSRGVGAGEPLDTGSGNARRVLPALATDFARQAHKDARCDLPARLPEG
ncbi:hypothetical protein ACWIG4_16795 [Streptomyces sp. NPDC002248]